MRIEVGGTGKALPAGAATGRSAGSRNPRGGAAGKASAQEGGLLVALAALDRLTARRLRVVADGTAMPAGPSMVDPAGGATALAGLEDLLGLPLLAADGTATSEAAALQGRARDVLAAAAAFFAEAEHLSRPPSPES